MNKLTTFRLSKEHVEIIDGELVKTAAVKLPDGVKYDPDFFYMRVRAVSAGESYGPNKNGDFFQREELKKSYKTFLNAHTFKNHENKDVANAIGDVLSAEWDDKMDAVILFIRIDRRLAPTIVRGFEKGYMTDVSMGCRIEYSLCSICGNKAKVRSEYCTHINNMRRKVFDDGDRVYEINIGPKFHDISAVLNGAEKVAKVTGLYIAGDKVAFGMEKAFEKVASIQETIEREPVSMANIESIITDNIEIPFEKVASAKGRKTNIQKIAEIKKEIQGRITGIAKGEHIKERLEGAEDLRNIVKLLYTKYWDKEKCSRIADYIKDIAFRKKTPVKIAFNEFLKVLDFAGIELSPLEFSDIYHSVIQIPTGDMRGIEYPEVSENFIEDVDKNVDMNDIDVSVPSAFDVVSNLLNHSNLLSSKIEGSRPLSKIKVIVMKLKSDDNVPLDTSIQDDMMDFISPMMADRSAHRRFIVKRITSLPEESYDNRAHFMPALLPRDTMSTKAEIIKKALPMLLYSVYQGDRVRRFNNGELDFGLNKFASYIEGDKFENILGSAIEKTAILGKGYTARKALVYGLPLTFGYSALQRSRIRNNENVSGLNRYIAENPANAYVLQALGGPALAKSLKAGLKKAKVKAEDISSRYYMGPKEASEKLYFEDMFKEASIDSKLLQKYTFSQVAMLKLAHIYLEQEREDLAENVLCKEKLSSSDLDAYLQICKDSIKIEFERELEKTAGALKDVALGALGGATFNKSGTSFLASAPAHIIDAAALTWLAKKLSEPKKEKEKPDKKS